MSFFTLNTDTISLILEELDPLSLLQLCLASRAMSSIVQTSTALQYRMELATCLMEDGPRSQHSLRDRLDSLRRHKHGWSTLTRATEARLCVAPPTVLGVSGNFLYLGAQHHNGHGWVLSVYELGSFRIIKPRATLHHYHYSVPFNVQRVAIDVTQNLMVLAQLRLEPDIMKLVLHFGNLDNGQVHGQAFQATIEHYIDWAIDSDFGSGVSVERVEISGPFVAISIGLKAEGGHAFTQLTLYNWRHGGSTILFLVKYLSFELTTVSESSCRLTVLYQPDDDDHSSDSGSRDSDDSDDSDSGAKERRLGGVHIDEMDERPPRIAVCYIDGSDHFERQYDFPAAWNQVAFTQLCPNSSIKKNMTPPSGTLFYNDPSRRLIAFVVEFEPDAIPSGCSRKVVVVIDESSMQVGQQETPNTVVRETWKDDWIFLNLPDRAEGVQLAGRRLVFFENAEESATSNSPSQLHVLDLNPHRAQQLSQNNPLWGQAHDFVTVNTVFDCQGSRYVRTSVVIPQNITWVDATEDNLVLYEEREDKCFIRILTF
ncbi:hypothetical protein F5I97DRAFT_1826878 [Phlebopus sp. FC_14]|nr:hypothetical protein F5I97DRAFT_1826878 [Phlebopus sp. FC_14]